MEQWEGMLNDKNILVAYKLDTEKEWGGRTLNKMEVMYSEYDKEYTIKANEKKYKLYLNKETNTVTKILEGQLPDDMSKYEPM